MAGKKCVGVWSWASVAMARIMRRFPSPTRKFVLRNSVNSSCCCLGFSEKPGRRNSETQVKLALPTAILGEWERKWRSCPWSWPRPALPPTPISSDIHQFFPLSLATGPLPPPIISNSEHTTHQTQPACKMLPAACHTASGYTDHFSCPPPVSMAQGFTWPQEQAQLKHGVTRKCWELTTLEWPSDSEEQGLLGGSPGLTTPEWGSSGLCSISFQRFLEGLPLWWPEQESTHSQLSFQNVH